MKFFNSINHYRALAIVMIIAVHAQFVADLKLDTYVSQFFFNAISGATLNFSFISGFLFYLVLYKNYKYSTFVRGRVNRFLKPYLFLSILPIVVSLITIPNYWDNSNLAEYNGWFWYLISIFKYVITGAHITAYWYIPFIVVMTLMSPLHVKFIKLKLKQQLIIFVILLIIASFVQRPYTRTFLFQAVQSMIYFTPLYLMGIMCAIHKDKIYKLLKGKDIYLLIIALGFVVLQTNNGDVGLYRNHFLTYNGVDLIIFKMVFVCLFFMVWLHRFEHVKSNIINSLANTSFAIYFLHVYILKMIFTVKNYFNLSFEGYSLLSYILIILLMLSVSMGVAIGVNKLFPKYSFYLIGYGKNPSKELKAK
ncbi:acyltransferase [Winogradskyella sp. Asnod2-B02-A]|uniref:acyltransferase family protein n=1 Tax=Winogradskyella sp. Asnod2-B02-A TaxID=3160583 RepID=UPI00386D2542